MVLVEELNETEIDVGQYTPSNGEFTVEVHLHRPCCHYNNNRHSHYFNISYSCLFRCVTILITEHFQL